jgi:hypothetical protein
MPAPVPAPLLPFPVIVLFAMVTLDCPVGDTWMPEPIKVLMLLCSMATAAAAFINTPVGVPNPSPDVTIASPRSRTDLPGAFTVNTGLFVLVPKI